MAASFSLTGSLRLSPTWTEPLDLVSIIDRTTISQSFALANGTAADQGDCYWKDVRTVAASATNTIDLTALPLNVYGGTDSIGISTLKLVYVVNRSATVSLTYSIGAASVTILPGGVFVWFGGGAAASPPIKQAGQIQVVNAGASAADYEIVLAGVKA